MNYTYMNRREAIRTIASASLFGFVPAAQVVAGHSKMLAPGISDSVLKSVRETVERGLARGTAVGVAIAVVNGDRIVWEEGFGWADREAKRRVTVRSPFSLQSVTKPFTTTLLATFAAAGQLRLDGPANHYLGANQIASTNGDAEKITVRLLGAHASGLPALYQSLYGGVPSPSAATLLEKYGRLAFPPNRVWEYSNVAYDALGAIAVNLAQADYGQLMAQRVLDPLGLRDSFWDTNRARVAASVARYDAAGQKIPYYVTTTPPSGELFASVHDLARFAMWNMKMPLGNGAALLNAHWLNELHQPAFTALDGRASTFGWALDHLKSGEAVLHKNGGGEGVTTIICLIPARKIACVVLANGQYAEEFTHNEICGQILKSYVPDWTTMPEENREPARKPFVLNDAMAGRWQGALANNGLSLPVQLEVTSSATASLRIGSSPAEPVTHLETEGAALVGNSQGLIDAAEALLVANKSLRLKVVRLDDKLVGRVIALGGPVDQPLLALPFVISMSRQ